jgi:hypothetical protein
MDERVVEIEVKLAFLEEQVQALSASLAREVRENVALADRVAVLERALSTLAQRVPRAAGGGADDVGADAATDPVPHSG